MIHLEQAVIVEGKYDKIRLSSFIDGLIIPTDGFSIFQDSEKRDWIRSLAKERGILILTDSDNAGRKIRNYIRSFVGKEGTIYHAYIPEILGKERRKATPSKEGTIGVEGMSTEILLGALKTAGVTEKKAVTADLTKVDLMEAGLVGGSGSATKRRQLLKKLSLPQNLSANAMLQVLNTSYTREEFEKLLKEVGDASADSPM